MQGQRIRKRDKTRCDLDVLIFLYARSAFLAPQYRDVSVLIKVLKKLSG